jgi:futalosine hydrolase
MRVLVVAATEEEVKGVRNLAGIDFLLTGVGMTGTAYWLMKKIAFYKYDLAINIGLAGSFREEIEIGEVVTVVSDTFADIGAEDGVNFLPVFEIGLQDKDQFPFQKGKLKPDFLNSYPKLKPLKEVNAITVNTVHGNETSIEKTIQKFNPDIESMEGAAFFYVCMMENIPCIQLRAISNKVERRNRSNWNIDLAIKNLDEAVVKFLSELKAD